MKNWNSLLVAVAFKRIDVVRYLLNDACVSLKMAGRNPDAAEDADNVATECFVLQIAAKNTDLTMLSELWSNFQAFDVPHLEHIVEHLIAAGWGAGLKSLLESYTTDVLFSSLRAEWQCGLVAKWVERVKAAPALQKDFDTAMQAPHFALPALCVYLEGEPTKALVEGCAKSVQDYEYYHFKNSTCFETLNERRKAFEEKGEEQKSAFATWDAKTADFETKMADLDFFRSGEEYANIQKDILTYMNSGDLDKLNDIYAKTDIRTFDFYSVNPSSLGFAETAEI